MIRLQNPAKEESTYVITLSFFDDLGAATAPTAATWTLTDREGSIKNSRENIAISTPGVTESIVLSGDDLKVNGARTELILTAKITYDSATGSDLPLNEEIRFWVDNLVKIPA